MRNPIRYLLVVTYAMMAFSAVMLVTPWVSEDLFGWMTFRETGPAPGAPEAVADYLVFSHRILGAVMIGWFLLIVWLVRGPLASRWPGAWQGLVTSLIGWFVVDTAASLILGYWENSMLNTAVLVAYLPGLIATRPSSSERPMSPMTS